MMRFKNVAMLTAGLLAAAFAQASALEQFKSFVSLAPRPPRASSRSAR
jgi:outer membrane lipoprotein carrier protein